MGRVSTKENKNIYQLKREELGLSREKASELFESLVGVLGLLYERKADKNLDSEIEALIEERQAARKNRDFARADAIRDELKAQGIILEDTPQGVKWHRA